MDFKSEINRFVQSSQAQTDEALQEIHRLNDDILTLIDKKERLITEITKLSEQHAPLIKKLREMKDLIAQWEKALAEHRNKLKTNEKLYKMQKDIKKNQKDITLHLGRLEAEKTAISDKISQFYTDHYINSTVGTNLQRDLNEQQAKLDKVLEKIEHLETCERKLHTITRLFLELLRSWGWISDPLAEQQKQMVTLSNDINAITETLREYNKNLEELRDLRGKEEQITLQKDSLLEQQEAVKHIEEMQQSIRETQKTIAQLRRQIKPVQKECEALQKMINNKALETKTMIHERLVQEIEQRKAVLREKNLALAQAKNPIRDELKNQFVTSLLDILNQQEQAMHKKKPQFFRPTSEETGVNSVPTYMALTRVQDAIRKFQKGLEPGAQENHLLSQISAKILIWQMSESDTQGRTFSARQTAHQQLFTEIAGLITKLPFDNPLRSVQHYIDSLTTPIESEPANVSTNKKTRKF